MRLGGIDLEMRARPAAASSRTAAAAFAYQRKLI